MLRVGIITMPSIKKGDKSFITDQNVKWFTDHGIDILPISYLDRNPKEIFKQINGLYLQGGPVYNRNYLILVKKLLLLAMDANDRGIYFPIWGTCHGFQTLIMIFEGVMENFDSELDYYADLHINTNIQNSNILSSLSNNFLQYIQKGKNIFFTHRHGISPKQFENNKQLISMFKILATTYDRNGKEYVSLIEGRNYPLYGSQFHPERLITLEPFRLFFVNELQKSKRTFKNKIWKSIHPTIEKCHKTRRNRKIIFVDDKCYLFTHDKN